MKKRLTKISQQIHLQLVNFFWIMARFYQKVVKICFKYFLVRNKAFFDYFKLIDLNYCLGQFVINEVVDTLKSNCPVNYLNVEIPENHEFNSIYKRSNFAFKKLSQSNKLQSKIVRIQSEYAKIL